MLVCVQFQVLSLIFMYTKPKHYIHHIAQGGRQVHSSKHTPSTRCVNYLLNRSYIEVQEEQLKYRTVYKFLSTVVPS